MADRGNDFKGRGRETPGRPTPGRPTPNSGVDVDSKAFIEGSRAKRMERGALHEAKGGARDTDDDDELIEDDEYTEVEAKEPRKGKGKRAQ